VIEQISRRAQGAGALDATRVYVQDTPGDLKMEVGKITRSR
jgi:hypothetical protein